MEIAKMLNTTILACLLILTGCLGLFDDDDVIDDADAQGDDTDSGSTTVVNNYYYNSTSYNNTSATPIVNTYPSVQSLVGNKTASINTSAGEYVELIGVWTNQCYDGGCAWRDTWGDVNTVSISCNTLSGYSTSHSRGDIEEDSDLFLPSDGGPCNYEFLSSYKFNIIYRVWS
jgi:hypothetical protein